MPAGNHPPSAVVDRIEELTRLEREATEDRERERYLHRRARLLGEVGYECRIREDDGAATLVLYPADWVEDGTVDPDRIEDTSRGVEIPLEAPASPEEWAAVESTNRSVVATVADRHGPVHAANARALADFMGNHYSRPIAEVTDRHRQVFLEDYYPRNVWPSDEERSVVERSVELTVAIAREEDG